MNPTQFWRLLFAVDVYPQRTISYVRAERDAKRLTDDRRQAIDYAQVTAGVSVD